MTGIPSETRIQKYAGQDSEVIEDQYARDERDRQLEKQATKTFHRDNRSSSRASDSSRKAGREIKTQQTWIEENK